MTLPDSPPFIALAFRNGLEYRNSNFRRFNDNYVSTSFAKLVRFGPRPPEFTRLKGIHPLVDQQFGCVRLVAPRLDAASISTEFCEAISTQFCFTYSLGGVTAMPRGLHARIYRAVDTMLVTSHINSVYCRSHVRSRGFYCRGGSGMWGWQRHPSP